MRRLEAIAAQTARLAAEMEPADAFSPASAWLSNSPRARTSSPRHVPQPAGAVRPDLGLPELLALLADTSTTMEHLGPDPASRQRIFNVIFDGLRSH
ncbi:hypothetical protein [Streptomyces sp. NRRL S-378]|uniref:SbtR family transcriptional regulator n=1 Tax=Streptomyces sp. NRRL S-378 TaxID=1463904 RepID=UPI00131DA541|nr:hypothetical protein [Streptomyces sp. NRRL S-378]